MIFLVLALPLLSGLALTLVLGPALALKLPLDESVLLVVIYFMLL